MKKLLAVLLVAMLSLAALPALAQDDTIVDITAGNAEFSTLVAAVEAAGLTDTLASGEFTVFAPRNGAFETLLANLGITAEELLADTELLTSVLTYHVVPGSVTFEDLTALAAESDGVVEVETVNGATLSLAVNSEEGLVNINTGAATVVDADIIASNGVIHVIDNVLLPPMDDEMSEEDMDMDDEDMAMDEEMDDEDMATGMSIVDIAAGNEDFSTLVAAVEAAELTETLATGEYTVFAPRNGAFATLLTELGISAEDLLADTDLLTSVLTYHVVPGSVTFADLVELSSERNDGLVIVETVNGATLRFSVDAEAGTAIINGGEASVVDADIMADNGVIHVLDNVLVPAPSADMDADMDEDMDEDMEEEAMGEGTIAEIAAANANFRTLTAALDAAGLVETLNEGEYTVFAPTNTAFQNLLSTLDMTAEELLESELLSDILLYHVVEGTVLAEDVVTLDGESVTTVSGGQFAVAVSEDGNVTINEVVNVTQTDIIASNGVIHVIDQVLLPQSAIDALGL